MWGVIKNAIDAMVEAFDDGTEPYSPDNRENAGETIDALFKYYSLCEIRGWSWDRMVEAHTNGCIVIRKSRNDLTAK